MHISIKDQVFNLPLVSCDDFRFTRHYTRWTEAESD